MLLAVLAVVAGFPVNVLTDLLPSWAKDSWVPWSVALGIIIGVVTIVEWLRTRSAGSGRLIDVPVQEAWVPRRELDLVLQRLRQPQTSTVALTTSLVGGGGFGKTALAIAVCHRSEVARRFNDVVWVTVGRDRSGADLADLVTTVTARISGDRSLTTFDPEQAGLHLAQVLTGRGATPVVGAAGAGLARHRTRPGAPDRTAIGRADQR